MPGQVKRDPVFGISFIFDIIIKYKGFANSDLNKRHHSISKEKSQ